MGKKVLSLIISTSFLLIASYFPAVAEAPISPLIPVGHGTFARIKHGTATNWSGYAVETNLLSPARNSVSNVQGQWLVPSLTCGASNTYSATWLGIDGYSDGTVEQIGTEQDCSSGKAVYYSWFEMYPRWGYYTSLQVKAGDLISARVTYLGNYRYSLNLANLTTNTNFSTIQRITARRTSAEWIMEAPWSGSTLPLANFGTQSFMNASATINGHTGTISDTRWQNDPITMVTSGGTIKAQPNPLTNGGANFDVVWHHN